MLYGDRVVLRPWFDADLPLLTSIRNDLELQFLLMAEPRPNPESRVRQWLQDRSTQTDTVFFVIARSCDNQPIGFTQAVQIDPRNGSAYLGICIAREYQSKGFGRDALILLESYLLQIVNLRKLLLEVLASNTGAISFYQQLGFSVVGALREHKLLRNEFRDVLIMEKMLIRSVI